MWVIVQQPDLIIRISVVVSWLDCNKSIWETIIALKRMSTYSRTAAFSNLFFKKNYCIPSLFNSKSVFNGSSPTIASPLFTTKRTTTILCVRKNGIVVMAGDGQVSLGSSVVKGNARKVRYTYIISLYDMCALYWNSCFIWFKFTLYVIVQEKIHIWLRELLLYCYMVISLNFKSLVDLWRFAELEKMFWLALQDPQQMLWLLWNDWREN